MIFKNALNSKAAGLVRKWTAGTFKIYGALSIIVPLS